MKAKISILLISFILVYGCTTSSDSNNTTVVIPVAPSNLNGVVIATSQVNLSWTDNASDETGFKIERKTGIGSYAVVGTVNTDVVTYNDSGLTPSTNYTYRVYSYNSAGNSAAYSNEFTLTTSSVSSLPILTTTAVTSITPTTAVSGGAISSDGGAAIIARGVCWSTSANPTVALITKSTNGTGTGVFASNLIALSANTTYHVRAYATNSVGTAYGADLSFITANTSSTSVTDVDGNTYQLVTICSQVWTKSNLNVTKYRNGDVIPQVTDPTQWVNLTTGAWCYYTNTTANGTTYGKLYNWYAVNDPRGLVPAGFHVPSNTEWDTLRDCLGGDALAGGAMKETGTAHWIANTNATNSSGFTGLPGGALYQSDLGIAGTFQSIGELAFFWSSTPFLSSAWYRRLNNFNGYFVKSYLYNQNGFSVRCIKD
ncbi:FISUMP domain-containing protein [Flavobacterium sp.]|uniref:FISUMP domain-containing protein n=1 Tax=Flavobacterium sp. TaxID=239 RepID=UPI0025D7C556|nr:FISUMP domain-containing protein [Flavobacterium sp.]